MSPLSHLLHSLTSLGYYRALVQFSSVQSLSRVQLFVTPWTAAHQASLSITSSRDPPKLTSIESVMLSNHLILCRPLLRLPSIFPSIRVSSNESALRIRWPSQSTGVSASTSEPWFEFPESYSKFPLTVSFTYVSVYAPSYSLHSSHPPLPLSRPCP